MLRSIFVFITISLMTFVLQYWFVSRLGYPETFATTCQNYMGEFFYEARCEYTFNILFTTITVAFLALFPFIISRKLSYFIIGCLWLGLLWLLGSVFITFDSTDLWHKLTFTTKGVFTTPFSLENYDQRTSFSSICSCRVIAFF